MSPRAKRHWLVKTEPTSYSIHDLERDGRTPWDGVRNYQARNTLRDEMAPGDLVLVYHSNADPLCVAGVARVASAARPDETAFDRKDHHFDRKDHHFDPKSKRDAPTWFLVDLEHVETFAVPVERERLVDEPALAGMELLRRGSRLSVQPVTPKQFEAVTKLARSLVRDARR